MAPQVNWCSPHPLPLPPLSVCDTCPNIHRILSNPQPLSPTVLLTNNHHRASHPISRPWTQVWKTFLLHLYWNSGLNVNHIKSDSVFSQILSTAQPSPTKKCFCLNIYRRWWRRKNYANELCWKQCNSPWTRAFANICNILMINKRSASTVVHSTYL